MTATTKNHGGFVHATAWPTTSPEQLRKEAEARKSRPRITVIRRGGKVISRKTHNDE